MSTVHNLRVRKRERGKIGGPNGYSLGEIVTDQTLQLTTDGYWHVVEDDGWTWEYKLTAGPADDDQENADNPPIIRPLSGYERDVIERYGQSGAADSLAFDLTFDPSQMCAVCVAGLNPPQQWALPNAWDADGRPIPRAEIEFTARWARALVERGGKLKTPNGNYLPMYASAVFRGTPLCEFDLLPALRGSSVYKL
jgi:hypothetical protein